MCPRLFSSSVFMPILHDVTGRLCEEKQGIGLPGRLEGFFRRFFRQTHAAYPQTDSSLSFGRLRDMGLAYAETFLESCGRKAKHSKTLEE